MYDEYNALVKNGTWLLVPRPASVNMVRSMWLFKHKFHADGTLSRYKARLVTKGSSQQLGVDFDETFSPDVKPAIIHIVLSLVVSRKWPIHQLDAKNAFLNGLFLSQKKYALQLLERAHMVTCNPSRTPVDTESKLGPKVMQICLYMHDLRESHFASLKHILRYVRGTVDFGLEMYVSATTSLVGYTDVDWTGCPSTRRSTLGYCVFLGDNLLSWYAKRQHTISHFSAEAEYRGVANVVAKIAWVHNLLTKHIEIDIHFVRDMVIAGQVKFLYVPYRFQYADIFTNGFPSVLFKEFQSSLSIRHPLALTMGCIS
nr:hypothetical protein [Tanacetum cinerariifolium]